MMTIGCGGRDASRVAGTEADSGKRGAYKPSTAPARPLVFVVQSICGGWRHGVNYCSFYNELQLNNADPNSFGE